MDVTKTVPQFAATFFGLTGMHMLHVTLGVVYLGVIALRSGLSRSCSACGCAPGWELRLTVRFTTARMCYCSTAIVISFILWLKPKVYDASDVEVAGLYWHFVDLVWMFIFPLVYLMSTRIV